MTVLLVVLLFAAFVAVDSILDRRRRAAAARAGEAALADVSTEDPRWVAGFRLPRALRYHRGHLWVRMLNDEEAVIGVDDFARRLIGRESRIAAPAVGAWVRQGKAALTVKHGREAARMAAPVSGEVVAVNPRLRNEPEVVHRDTFHHGWLFRIRSSRLAEELGNLMDGTLAERWMEDTRYRFQHSLMAATGSAIQDGGALVDDVAAEVGPEEWRALAHEFFEPQHADRG